jgi:guanylate kinase
LNKLIIISGPSGSGKSTIAKSAMDNEVVSFTTRPPRPGEINGKDYVFMSQEEFDKLLHNNGLAEYTTYYGNASYGITLDELHGKLEKGHAFVIVDVIGLVQLKKLWDNTASVFIMTSEAKARKRMNERGDSAQRIEDRLKTYGIEQENFYLYDYVLDNNNTLAEAIEGMKNILQIEGVLQ